MKNNTYAAITSFWEIVDYMNKLQTDNLLLTDNISIERYKYKSNFDNYRYTIRNKFGELIENQSEIFLLSTASSPFIDLLCTMEIGVLNEN